MKAPDKLYINKYMIRPGMLHPAEFPPDNPEEEYIRKGALIDALNKILDARPPEAKGPASTIAAMVFQQLIDKINSL